MSLLTPHPKRSWKPIRNGDTYCSPACGRGCTIHEFNEANRKGNALLKKLKGHGWRLNVWENLGWHYSVELGDAKRGGISVRCGDDGKFWCLIGNTPDYGNYQWSHGHHSYRDPNRAVNHALNTAKRAVARDAAIVDFISKAVSTS